MFAASLTLFIGLVGLSMAVYLVSAGGSAYLQSGYGKESSMALARDNGIIDTSSTHSVDETVEKLKNILQAKGVSVFVLIGHSGEAEKVGKGDRAAAEALLGGAASTGDPNKGNCARSLNGYER